MTARDTAYAATSAPDFIMLGVPHNRGVAIYASTELTAAELRAETDFADDLLDPLAHIMRVQRPVRTRYFITAEMKTWVVAYGPDYAQAMSTLMAHWKPDSPERTPIAAALPEIEGGK